ncbi:Nucleotide-binding universal stress protein, UspA family [Andreprevotia lacus DSM 23236]|uniref:Nucleotide-binding universal stress protein, UspA family n=1 Tax=Andreprevotia lacus DSM 23236 TaxID=1121001 RepID=A0A1W1Y1G5_9NEIS|nr:universal stress protein [Andreprevotia lacus]SMC29992.1 Nucleotide-binding universal stress protein, UspA family [Andreprevotia lacus DSM 23236]
MYKRILVPLDGSPAAEKGLQQAIPLAATLGAELRLFHVIDLHLIYMDVTGMGSAAVLGDYEQRLRQLGRDLLQAAREQAEQTGVAADVRMAECYAPQVAELIVAEASRWPADLIVMGTHGRRGLRGLVMGSDAESVLHVSPVPVLLVRSGQ